MGKWIEAVTIRIFANIGFLAVIITIASSMVACQAANQTPAIVKPSEAPPQITPQPPAQTTVAPPASQIAWVADGAITAGEYQKGRLYGDYEISWASDDQYIYIGIKAKTTGWVAVGFDPETKMKNADIVMGYVKDGRLLTADMFSTGEFGPHPPDTEQGGTDDIIQSAGKLENGYTTIEFKRKLDTGDKFDKPLHKGINKIMWASGSDPQFTIKHMARGYGELDL